MGQQDKYKKIFQGFNLKASYRISGFNDRKPRRANLAVFISGSGILLKFKSAIALYPLNLPHLSVSENIHREKLPERPGPVYFCERNYIFIDVFF